MAPSVVQTQSNTGAGVSTLAVTLTATVAQNTLIVCVGNNGLNFPPTGVATSGGQSLTLATQSLDGNNANATIWYLDNVPAGQTSVTVTWSAGPSHSGVVAYEVSGVYAAGGSFDQTAVAFLAGASPTAWTSGASPTLSQASEIAIGCSAQIGISLVITGPASPWTNTSAVSSGGVIAGQKVVAATTAVTYNGSTTHAGTEQTATVVATFKAGTPPAGGGPSGTVQPRATVPVPRRSPRRALWQRITGQGVAQVPAPVQQPGPAPRRRRLRAWVQFAPVTTTNATPPNGTVQPSAARPAPRRKLARAWVRFVPVATVNATPAAPVSGTVQPRATVPVPRRARLRAVARGLLVPGIFGTAPAQEYQTPPRRRRARALVQFTPVKTSNNVSAIPGTIQPAPTAPVHRRTRTRAIARGLQVPGVRGAAPRQLFQTPRRRRRARASVKFTPVKTTNALIPRTLLISLASQAGTDDHGNAYPQGILATEGVIEGPTLIGSDAFFYNGTPAFGNLVQSITEADGTDQFGNAYIAGTTTYNSVSFWSAVQVSGGSVTWYTASGPGGPWTVEAGIGFAFNALTGGNLVLQGTNGTLQLPGGSIPQSLSGSIGTLPPDGNSGTGWVTGERAFMNNNWVNVCNNNFAAIVAALQAAGIAI